MINSDTSTEANCQLHYCKTSSSLNKIDLRIPALPVANKTKQMKPRKTWQGNLPANLSADANGNVNISSWPCVRSRLASLMYFFMCCVKFSEAVDTSELSEVSNLCTLCKKCTTTAISEILSIISQNLERSCDLDHAKLRDDLSVRRLIFHMANQCTKFEVSISHSRDILGRLKI